MKVSEEVKIDEEVKVNAEADVSEEVNVNAEADVSVATKAKKEFKIDKELLTKLIFFVGVAMVFIVGVLFSVLCDLKLKAGSSWLIGGILLTFGSGACAVLSETFREKPIVKWIMKGLAVAMAAAFIGLAVGMQGKLLVINATEPEIRVAIVPVMATLMALDALAVVVLACDVTLNALQKEE